MFVSGSSDRWGWSEDVFLPVAFCVEAFVRDGLRVPPFDQHPDGDGELRDLGLDETMWQEWLAAILAQQAVLSTFASALGADPDRAELRSAAQAAGDVLRRPGSVCPGRLELRVRLDDLWTHYESNGNTWRRRMTAGEDSISRQLAPAEQRSLWHGLMPFHDRLLTISVFLVAYREPIVMALPPTTCLIAPDRRPHGYSGQVLAAARLLAETTT